MARRAVNPTYLIPVLSKALDVLEVLHRYDQPLTLETIHRQTHVSKTTTYRILKTLVHRGYLANSQDGLYRVVTRPRKPRFGYGEQCREMPFSEAVTASLRDAAVRAGVELVVLDNRYDAATAIQVAEEFVRRRVDLVIEFQIDQHAAPVIADKIAAAGIPLIAIDIPHPRAIFFGVDNYRVGVEAGELLAEHAQQVWNGRVDSVLGLDIDEAGPIVQSRITGSFQAIQKRLPHLAAEAFFRMDGGGTREKNARIVADFMNRHKRDRHILISAANDTSALGALETVRELGREKHVAIVGQDCIPEAIEEMRRPGSPWIGSVSYEAAKYGPALIHLGLTLLQGATVHPYNFVEHKLMRAEDLRSAAANDTSARQEDASESALLPDQILRSS